MYIQMVRRWMRAYREEGRTDVHDAPRSGRPSDSKTFENVQQIRDLLYEDHRMTISELCFRLQAPECARTSVFRIVHDVLGFRKLSARWVPRLLTEEHRKQRLGAALTFLTAYNEEGESLISRIITGDESWVHHVTPESKQASMAWCAPGEKPPTKAKSVNSAGKIMATVFWDAYGILHVEYMPKGTTLNKVTYQATLKALRTALRRKRPWLSDDDVFFLHDNARPHTAGPVRDLLAKFGWYVFPHPPYSPDLAPSDFFLFPKLKQALGGQRFSTDAEVTSAVKAFFRKQSTEFYRDGLSMIVHRYSKCLGEDGTYVEK